MCESFQGLVWADDGNVRLLAHLRCKQWTCPECAEQNKRHWIAVILDATNKDPERLWSFVTLTAHKKAHKDKTGKYSLKNLSRGWDRLCKRIKRRHEAVSYVRVYEEHRSAIYHLHAIMSLDFGDYTIRNRGKEDSYSDSPWLRSAAVACGMGYMTSAGLLKKSAASKAFYIAKYMTKMSAQESGEYRLKHVRRIQTSRDIKYLTVSTSELRWAFIPEFTLTDFLYAQDSVKQVYNLSEKREVTSDDFLVS